MNLTRAAQDKWSQPGWRIEKKYTNKVLLGNWAEERQQGLPAKLLFAQQGSPSSHGLVTHYEESYGRKCTNALPTLQPCHQKSSTWPLQRPNTGNVHGTAHTREMKHANIPY
uniref:Uncharacterized protein n=1 Tax=Periophthalmus magnuspinnatus TaxID=409849 RepID=A0A3B4A0D1_9GOBI